MISLFNTIMLRVGTTLLTTFVLVLSSLAYTIANGKPFVVVVLLQVIVFAGVYMERDKLLGMIGLRDEGTGRVHCRLRQESEWESVRHSAVPRRAPGGLRCLRQITKIQAVKPFSRRRRISVRE